MKAGTKEYYADYYSKNKDRHNNNMKRFKEGNVEYYIKDKLYKKEKYQKQKENTDPEILKEQWRQQALKRVKERRDFINQYKSKCSCKKCGDTRIYVLDFHHIDPSQKSFELGEASTKGISKIKLELEKCITLCRNCHSEFHYLEKEYNTTIEQYLI